MAKEAKERDQDLRNWWLEKLAIWTMEGNANMFVFLDESAVDEKTGQPRYGWAHRGERARINLLAKRTTKFSILPAITVDGFLECEVHEGSINTEIFEDFMGKILEKHSTPYPGPNSLYILDNCEIHRSEVRINHIYSTLYH